MNGDDKKKPPRSARDEDLDLWRYVTRDTKPLKGRETPAEEAGERAKPAKQPPKPRPAKVVPRTKRMESEAPPAAPLAAGALADVDKRTADRLKRGRLPIEGRLDLHGLRQEEARGMLDRFLADAQGAGKRCVLVITGKGAGREGGVMRQNLPHWLNLPENRARLVAFAPAQPKDGGHGAFYLLLKRRRP